MYKSLQISTRLSVSSLTELPHCLFFLQEVCFIVYGNLGNVWSFFHKCFAEIFMQDGGK